MKTVFWLTILQALAINAAPHHRRDYCTSEVGTEFTTVISTPTATVTIISTSTPATEILPTVQTSESGVVQESSSAISSVSASEASTYSSIASTTLPAVQTSESGSIQESSSSVSFASFGNFSYSSGAANTFPTVRTSTAGIVQESSNGVPFLPSGTLASGPGASTIQSAMQTSEPGFVQESSNQASFMISGTPTFSSEVTTAITTLPLAQTSESAIVQESSNGVPFVLPGSSTYSSMASTTEAPASSTTSDAKNSQRDEGPFTSLSSTGAGPEITSVVAASVSVITTAISSGTAQILPSASTQTPETSGTILSSLDKSGIPTSAPILSTSIATPTTTIAPNDGCVSPNTATTVAATPLASNIFVPIATDAPPALLESRQDHPVPRLGISQNSPVGTNKFYANFFLGSQTAGTWTHPYSVAWSKGGGATGSWGMTIQQLEDTQKVFGPNSAANPVEYYINPIGIQPIVLSAVELGNSMVITNTDLTAFSSNVNLLANPGAQPTITFPLVQGMGFVTGIFNGGTPILQSGVLFRSITKSTTDPKPGVSKFTIVLEDGHTWFVYASQLTAAGLDLVVVNNGLIKANSNFNGVIQIAKNTGGDAEALYDASAGAYATTAAVSGSVDGNTGSYTLSFTKGGIQATTLMMFCLTHHLESFVPETSSAVHNGVQLVTTTKGKATAVIADSWTLNENLPTSMGFAPFIPTAARSNGGTLSSNALNALHDIALSEVSQDMNAQSNLNSMYYSGKALAKFAQIIYVLHDILNDKTTAQSGLSNLKGAFSRFTSNTQQFPLVHETAWGGVVSSASYTTGDGGADFGNTYYNDHHFHYGYFIYAAAIIGYLDPTWIPENAPWVNTLVRDVSNPSEADPFFPVSRNFDWYHGHSWAHGLYETFDGKDEESSSEDSMCAYAIKMWGHTIGDSNMEARGNLQLAITARSLQNYFLYESTNNVQPANFIGNKVSGILFENKIDHTTYFGANPEYIEGIHMLPLLPSSTLTRTTKFVQEEWDTYFSKGRAEAVVGGWKGVLFANLALINPTASWNFFTASDWDASWLDGGASRTWYLAMAAGLGGAPQ